MLLELSCGQLRFPPSLYTPSLPLLLPILPSGALGELLPVSSRLLLSVQFPQGLHQVGGSSRVTCKTPRGIQPLAGEEQVPSAAMGCRALQKKLRSQMREASVRRCGVMGRRPSRLCHRLQLTLGLAAKADGISPAAQPATPLFRHGLGFSLQAVLHPQKEGASVRTGTSRFGRSR